MPSSGSSGAKCSPSACCWMFSSSDSSSSPRLIRSSALDNGSSLCLRLIRCPLKSAFSANSRRLSQELVLVIGDALTIERLHDLLLDSLSDLARCQKVCIGPNTSYGPPAKKIPVMFVTSNSRRRFVEENAWHYAPSRKATAQLEPAPCWRSHATGHPQTSGSQASEAPS